MKRCSTCGRLLPENGFYKDKAKKDGLHNQCKECHKQSVKQNKQRHRKEYLERAKKWRNSLEGKYSMYKGRAKFRNQKFILSFEDFKNLVSQPCYYCGKEPANGLDRINSNKGYVLDNVVPCCKYCNIAKSDLSLEEFYYMIEKRYLNMENKKLIWRNEKIWL